MKVFLFSDYLKLSNDESLKDSDAVCVIDKIDHFPGGLVKVNGKLARPCMLSQDGFYIEYVSEPPRNNKVYHSNNITCPHCGDEDEDSWECSDSDGSRICYVCGSVFSYEREVEVTYSSKIIDRNEEILSLN